MDLTYTPSSTWPQFSPVGKDAVFAYAEDYKAFLDQAKTERLGVQTILDHARQAGFLSLHDLLAKGPVAGDKLYLNHKNKAVVLLVLGQDPLSTGLNIVGSHLDAPRLDLKPHPLQEGGETAYFKTHYYGGVRKYQWATIPLALHGLAYTQDSKEITFQIGEDPQDPVFYISDLLPHLAKDQNKKSLAEGLTGEQLEAICGHIPGDTDEKNPIKYAVLSHLHERYGLQEADFHLAELQLVPAGPARDVGFDRGLVMAYAQDDRSSVYASLRAMLDVEKPKRTAAGLFVDKEEIGSVGNTGMGATFFEDLLTELLAATEPDLDSHLALRRAMRQSVVLSADVTSAFDPAFPDVSDKTNVCRLGHGVAIKKYGGARGKSGSNDANAEFLQGLRQCLSQADVPWQTGEMGKIDQGGGGTIAYLLADRGCEVVDLGTPLLSMHAPQELASKADLYTTYRACAAFHAWEDPMPTFS